MLFSDEGHDFVKACHDPKSNIGEVTRTMWSGRLAGQGNASAEARRILPGGATRCRFWSASGKGAGGVPLRRGAGEGTPQRFVHTWSVSPDIPDHKPDHPGRLTVRVPTTNSRCARRWRSGWRTVSGPRRGQGRDLSAGVPAAQRDPPRRRSAGGPRTPHRDHRGGLALAEMMFGTRDGSSSTAWPRRPPPPPPAGTRGGWAISSTPSSRPN